MSIPPCPPPICLASLCCPCCPLTFPSLLLLPRAKPGISNETLRNVQNEVVLLVKDPVVLQATGRRPGEFVPIEILLANWTFMQTPQ